MDFNFLRSYFQSKKAVFVATITTIFGGLAGLALALWPESNIVGATSYAVFFILFLLLTTSVGIHIYEQLGKSLVDQVAESSRKVFQELVEQASNQQEQSYRYSAQRYGIGYESLSVECTIDEKGAATIRRRVELKAYADLEELDTYLQIPESDNDEDISLQERSPRSLSEGKSIVIKDLKKDSGRLTALFKFIPSLRSGESLTYEVTETIVAGSFAIGLTEEELNQRADKVEYFGWNINRPTRRLSIQIYFPESAKPRIVHDARVRYALAVGLPSRTVQREEQKFLERPILSGPEGTQYLLKFDVEYPMTGLIYLLSWDPTPVPE
jgi:hypothetical protein